MMLKTMRKHGVTLALFAAGSTGLTAAINELTKSTIDQQATLQQKAQAATPRVFDYKKQPKAQPAQKPSVTRIQKSLRVEDDDEE